MFTEGTGKKSGHPILTTRRLVLRPFEKKDLNAILMIFGDEELNTFLPWFPLKTMEDARQFFLERYERFYHDLPESPQKGSWEFRYAVCRREEDIPIGYVHLGGDDSHDLGYGLKREFRGQGFMTEAAGAVLDYAGDLGLPFVTATHDVKNPKSGRVMERLGLTYRYSYEEFWQPKGFLVTFRMYQKNFDGSDGTFMGYWEQSKVHFVSGPQSEELCPDKELTNRGV